MLAYLLMVNRKSEGPGAECGWLTHELGGKFDLNATAVIRQAYKLIWDLGFQVEGAAVESGVFHLAIHGVDAAVLVGEKVVLHDMKKAPRTGPKEHEPPLAR
jgi:hypothetical protein